VGVEFCWPVIVLYRLAARTWMWLSMAKFWPISINNFLVVMRVSCRCSKILVLRALCVSVCPEFPCRLL